MTATDDTYEVFDLEKSEPSPSGLGHADNAVEYLQVEGDTLVFRFRSNARPSSLISPRRSTSMDFSFWYQVFGWKVGERYRSTEFKTSAIRVRPVRKTDEAHLETLLRAAKAITPSTRIVFYDGRLP